jgi:hypothetical protein
MKQKNLIYRPQPPSASVPLSTLALFQRDTDGRLVRALPINLSRWKRNPKGEERRTARRFEWRHDSLVWTVTSQGRVDANEARTCEVSRGGCSLLLDHEIQPGSLLDLHVDAIDEAVCLPLLRVLEATPKGSVWLLRCVWLQKLTKSTMGRLLGRRLKPRRKSNRKPRQPHDNWLLRLWRRFHAA